MTPATAPEVLAIRLSMFLLLSVLYLLFNSFLTPVDKYRDVCPAVDIATQKRKGMLCRGHNQNKKSNTPNRLSLYQAGFFVQTGHFFRSKF